MKHLIAAVAMTVIPLSTTTAHADIAHRCPEYEKLLVALAPEGGWDVRHMSKVMYNESRCRPDAGRQHAAKGLLQVLRSWGPKLSEATGLNIDSRTLMNPSINIMAAAALCTRYREHHLSCYKPWASSTRPPARDIYFPGEVGWAVSDVR